MNSLLNIAVLGLAGAGMVAAQAPEEGPPGACVPLADAAAAAGNLGRLGQAIVSIVGESEEIALLLNAPIQSPAPVTIFAPEDAAWPEEAEVPTGDDLLALLSGHVVTGYFPADAILEAFQAMDEVALPTLLGTELIAALEDPDIFVASTGMEAPAKVVTADIMTCAGVIHVVDAILVPGDAMAPGPAPSAVVTRELAPIPAADITPGAAIPPSAMNPTAVAAPPVDEAVAPTEVGEGADETGSGAGSGIAAPADSGAPHVFVGTVVSAFVAIALLA